MNLKDKVRDIHEFVQGSYYLSDNNLGDYNDVILYTVLTALKNGKQMIVGNYGTGKTTTAEAVSSIVYGYPVEVLQFCKLNGQPFLTEEKIFGRPNLAELQKGREKVEWSNFSKFKGPKICDELNRMHEGAQNVLLDSIDRGIFRYLNETINQPQVPFYATVNYPDSGNTPIIPPLSDRFDISVEVSPVVGKTVYFDQARKNKEILSDPIMTSEIMKALHNGEDTGSYREKFRNKLEQSGIPVFSDEEITDCARKINDVKLDSEADMFVNVFFGEANAITKVSGEIPTVHYENVLVGRIKNNLSGRWVQSTSGYAKAMTYSSGEETSGIDDVKQAITVTLPHRVIFDEKYRNNNPKEPFFEGSQQKWLSQQIVADFLTEFHEKKEDYKAFISALMDNGDMKKFEGKDSAFMRSVISRKSR